MRCGVHLTTMRQRSKRRRSKIPKANIDSKSIPMWTDLPENKMHGNCYYCHRNCHNCFRDPKRHLSSYGFASYHKYRNCHVLRCPTNREECVISHEKVHQQRTCHMSLGPRAQSLLEWVEIDKICCQFLSSIVIQMANVLPPYRGKGEVQFLKVMMAIEIENDGYTPSSTFRQESMLNVFKNFRTVYVPIYSDRFLNMKIKQLKKKYQKLLVLMCQDEIFWNKSNVKYKLKYHESGREKDFSWAVEYDEQGDCHRMINGDSEKRRNPPCDVTPAHGLKTCKTRTSPGNCTNTCRARGMNTLGLSFKSNSFDDLNVCNIIDKSTYEP